MVGTHRNIHDLMEIALVQLEVLDLFLHLCFGGLSDPIHAYGIVKVDINILPVFFNEPHVPLARCHALRHYAMGLRRL